MNKQTIAIIIGMFLISFASAMYAGDCQKVNLSKLESLDNVVYDVVGNSSDMEGLTIDLNGTIANICTVINYKPDNFTIIFIDNSTKESVVHHYSSGGTRTRYKTEYVDRNITKYIERDNITYVDRKLDDDEDLCEETKNLAPYVFGLLIIYLVSILIFIAFSIRKVRKKVKEQEVPKEEPWEEPQYPTKLGMENIFSQDEVQ